MNPKIMCMWIAVVALIVVGHSSTHQVGASSFGTIWRYPGSSYGQDQGNLDFADLSGPPRDDTIGRGYAIFNLGSVPANPDSCALTFTYVEMPQGSNCVEIDSVGTTIPGNLPAFFAALKTNTVLATPALPSGGGVVRCSLNKTKLPYGSTGIIGWIQPDDTRYGRAASSATPNPTLTFYYTP